MSESIPNGPQMEQAVDAATNNRKAFKSFNRMGWAVVIFLGSQMLLPAIVYMIVSVVAPALVNTPLLGMPLSYVCMYLIGFPLMLLLLRKLPETPAVHVATPPKKLSIGAILALYPVCYAVMNVLAMLVNWLEQSLGTSSTVTTADLVQSNIPQWFMFLAGVVIAPTMEEIIFRKLAYKKLSGYGALVYIVWTSVCFGLIHLNLGQAVYAAAMGVILAIVMYQTGSVKYTIILHIMVNFTGGIGIGSIILRSGNQLALNIYSYYVLALMVVGVVIGIIMLVRKFFAIHEEKTANTLAKKSVALLNPGTLVFCLICLAVIVFFM